MLRKDRAKRLDSRADARVAWLTLSNSVHKTGDVVQVSGHHRRIIANK